MELPNGEGVVLEIVREKPWLAFCEYLGDLRSRIAVNVDLPMSAIELLHLAIHETYPGHHVERCCKEQLLVRGRGLVEETIVLVPAPQSLVAEGIAELAVSAAARGRGRARSSPRSPTTPASTSTSLTRSPSSAQASRSAGREVNAALMLHDADATEDEARAYLERWGLMTPSSPPT